MSFVDYLARQIIVVLMCCLMPLPCFAPFDRHYVQSAAEDEKSEVELFLNSVPLLASLHREEKLQLVGAFLEEVFPGTWVQFRFLTTNWPFPST